MKNHSRTPSNPNSHSRRNSRRISNPNPSPKKNKPDSPNKILEPETILLTPENIKNKDAMLQKFCSIDDPNPSPSRAVATISPPKRSSSRPIRSNSSPSPNSQRYAGLPNSPPAAELPLPSFANQSTSNLDQLSNHLKSMLNIGTPSPQVAF